MVGIIHAFIHALTPSAFSSPWWESFQKTNGITEILYKSGLKYSAEAENSFTSFDMDTVNLVAE